MALDREVLRGYSGTSETKCHLVMHLGKFAEYTLLSHQVVLGRDKSIQILPIQPASLRLSQPRLCISNTLPTDRRIHRHVRSAGL